MHRPTARVLTVLELLQVRRMTGAELARRLEVDRRTARRYVETLREMGIPVEGERGRYGAYYLGRGYKLPPMMFTDEEALGLRFHALLTDDGTREIHVDHSWSCAGTSLVRRLHRHREIAYGGISLGSRASRQLRSGEVPILLRALNPPRLCIPRGDNSWLKGQMWY